MMTPILSVLLFGFVHPGSKIILGTNISLLHFCLLYSGFRLLTQIPIVLVKKHYLIPSKIHLLLLVGMGLIGAALQLTEFKGITDGLPVSVVTFLLYSYPLWTVLLSWLINGESITSESIIKVVLSIIGMIFILKSQLQDFKFDSALVFPIIASVLMALWICLSNLSKKKGCSSWSISFYYDLFAFLTLINLTYFNEGFTFVSSVKTWMLHDYNSLLILGYAVILGVAPNLLFYKASQNLSAMAASLLLLFEPVISTLTSALIWNETITVSFMIGAALLLVSNIPFNIFNFLTLKETL